MRLLQFDQSLRSYFALPASYDEHTNFGSY